MSWEDVLKREFDITEKDKEEMREHLEVQITDMMSYILNEYNVGASNDSFYMPTVNEGLDKIFEAMMGYVEGSDMTIEGATRESDLRDARSRKEGILLPMAAGRLDIDD